MAVKTLSQTDAYAGAPEKKYTLYMLMLGFIALMVGTFFGPLQSFNYGGLDLYPFLKPVFQNYYQGLTLHGVLNAIIFTQLFGQAIMVYLPARELGLDGTHRAADRRSTPSGQRRQRALYLLSSAQGPLGVLRGGGPLCAFQLR